VRRTPALLLIPLIGSLAACGDDQDRLSFDDGVSIAPGDAPPSPTTLAALIPEVDGRSHPEAQLVTTRFGYTPDEKYVVSKALNVLIAECVEKETGLPRAPLAVKSAEEFQLEENLSRDMLLFDDPLRASTDGYYWLYYPVTAPSEAAAEDPRSESADCVARANAQLSTNGLALSNEPSDLAVVAAKTVTEATEGKDLAGERDAWTKCLADAGFPDRTFPIPVKRSEVGTDIELRLAAADVGCRQSTGLMDAVAALLVADASAFEATNEVSSYTAARESEVASAVVVLTDRGLLSNEDLAAMGAG